MSTAYEPTNYQFPGQQGPGQQSTPQPPAPPETAYGVNLTGSAQILANDCAACRVSVRWFGTRKTLDKQQKAQAAESFGAEGDFISASKKILDTRDDAYKACVSVKNEALTYWRCNTLPYPEDGIRLIRRQDVTPFADKLTGYQNALAERVASLEERYQHLREQARDSLGSLFNAADYPATLIGAFGLTWDFPNVTPPEYLRNLNPALYEREAERARARFTEAVELAEAAFCDEFGKLVEHLAERLAGNDGDGKPKVFRDSAIVNFDEFFDRFTRLNVHSNEELDALVANARGLLNGIEPKTVRNDVTLRRSLADNLGRIQGELELLTMEKPRRRLMR